jgi:hypothetical protein
VRSCLSAPAVQIAGAFQVNANSVDVLGILPNEALERDEVVLRLVLAARDVPAR